MSELVTISIIVLCILGQAFFSGAEIAMVSVDRLRARHLAKSGHRPSQQVIEMIKKPEWILGTTLLGTNLCVVVGTTLATSQFYSWLGGVGVPIAIIVMTFINLVLAEIVPKSIFQQLSDWIAPRIIFALRLFTVVLFPLVWLFSKLAALLALPFGGINLKENLGIISKEELKLMMKMKHEKGDVKPSERKMINRLLHFTETEAGEIMVPLIDVTALSDQATIKEACDKFTQTKHRRLPIYHNRVDRIIGILISFDILGENSTKRIKPFIRPAYYIPPTMGVTELLKNLQNNGRSMAVVVDEFGGAVGIVTVEDILEEIVGNIEDEYDAAERLYALQKDGSIVINGRMTVEDLNEHFELKIPEGDYETVGGFIIHHLKRIPKAGEKLSLPNLELTITKATSRLIQEIIIQQAAPRDDPKSSRDISQ
jgi:putative hemolysin